MRAESPAEIDPEPIIGQFAPIPKGSYPSFIQLAEMKIDFQVNVLIFLCFIPSNSTSKNVKKKVKKLID